MGDEIPEPFQHGLDEFIVAAGSGNVERLMPYLEKYDAVMSDPRFSKQLRRPNERLQQALYEAAREDHAEIVDLLLSKGFHLDTTLILYAGSGSRRNSSVDTFETLLKHGWDVNQSLGHSGDALTWASFTGNTSLVRWLLSKGAKPDLNLRYDEHTALECAARKGHLASTKLLVEAGSQIQNRSALTMAAAEGHVDVVRYLLEAGANINEIPDNDEVRDYSHKGSTKNALCAAASNGRVEVVKLLLDQGGDKSIKDSHGKTPLQLAEQNGHEECVKLLK